jgi:hypothetical protein
MDTFTNSQIEYYKKLADELLADFPDFKNLINMRYFGKDVDSPLLSAEGHLSDKNSLYQNSQYCYKDTDLSFLHFTNFKALLSILNSQSIRFKTLNGMNDINEINYAAKLFGFSGKPLEFLQKEIFSFSLVRYLSTDKEIENNTNNLDLWRFYGESGDGVAIKFKLLNNPNKWESFHMSPIYYGEKGTERLIEFQKKMDDFNSKNQNFYIHLPNIFSFHKSNHFKNEDEVRLLNSTRYDFRKHIHQIPKTISDLTNQTLPNPPIKIDNSENYFTTVPLSKKMNSSLENRFFAFAPQFEIEEIILGYKFKEDELDLYRNVINSVNGVSIAPNNIYITELKDLFRA